MAEETTPVLGREEKDAIGVDLLGDAQSGLARRTNLGFARTVLMGSFQVIELSLGRIQRIQ